MTGRQQQPYDPMDPAGKPPGGPPHGEGSQEGEQKKRILWVQSQQNIPVGALAPELSLMSLPASASIDVFISYQQPGNPQTIISPDGREVFRLYANEQLTSRILTTFSPGGHVPNVGGNSLPPVGRIFAIRDFPADGWELKISTSDEVPDPDAAPTLFLNVTCVGWSREPTGIGPFELQTLIAGGEQSNELLTFVAMGGLSDVDIPAFTMVPVFNLIDPWEPSNGDKAGAFDVIMCGVNADTGEITPVVLNPDGSLPSSAPPSATHWTEALAGSLVVRNRGCLIEALSGRIDATATDATYYIQIWNLDAVPANATNFTEANGGVWAPHKIVHVAGTDDEFEIEIPGGFDADTGFTVTLSTTEFVKSASPGNFMSATGVYRDGSGF